jgi:hypothetical protein
MGLTVDTPRVTAGGACDVTGSSQVVGAVWASALSVAQLPPCLTRLELMSGTTGIDAAILRYCCGGSEGPGGHGSCPTPPPPQWRHNLKQLHVSTVLSGLWGSVSPTSAAHHDAVLPGVEEVRLVAPPEVLLKEAPAIAARMHHYPLNRSPRAAARWSSLRLLELALTDRDPGRLIAAPINDDDEGDGDGGNDHDAGVDDYGNGGFDAHPQQRQVLRVIVEGGVTDLVLCSLLPRLSRVSGCVVEVTLRDVCWISVSPTCSRHFAALFADQQQRVDVQNSSSSSSPDTTSVRGGSPPVVWSDVAGRDDVHAPRKLYVDPGTCFDAVLRMLPYVNDLDVFGLALQQQQQPQQLERLWAAVSQQAACRPFVLRSCPLLPLQSSPQPDHLVPAPTQLQPVQPPAALAPNQLFCQPDFSVVSAAHGSGQCRAPLYGTCLLGPGPRLLQLHVPLPAACTLQLSPQLTGRTHVNPISPPNMGTITPCNSSSSSSSWEVRQAVCEVLAGLMLLVDSDPFCWLDTAAVWHQLDAYWSAAASDGAVVSEQPAGAGGLCCTASDQGANAVPSHRAERRSAVDAAVSRLREAFMASGSPAVALRVLREDFGITALPVEVSEQQCVCVGGGGGGGEGKLTPR